MPAHIQTNKNSNNPLYTSPITQHIHKNNKESIFPCLHTIRSGFSLDDSVDSQNHKWLHIADETCFDGAVIAQVPLLNVLRCKPHHTETTHPKRNVYSELVFHSVSIYKLRSRPNHSRNSSHTLTHQYNHTTHKQRIIYISQTNGHCNIILRPYNSKKKYFTYTQTPSSPIDASLRR